MNVKTNVIETERVTYSMDLLTAEEVMVIFKKKKPKDIYNMLYNEVLPRSLTLKIGSNLYFVKSKLDEFLEEQYNLQHRIN